MRREFSKGTKREAYRRSRGICECPRLAAAGIPGFADEGCGQGLGPANTFYEHIICDGIGGDPTLENCAVLVKTCWRIKTDTYDQPVVAKAVRMTDRNIGISRSSGRGFGGSRLKRRMDGTVVDRFTGAPISRGADLRAQRAVEGGQDGS
jgi:hypothetical protein